MRFPAWVLIASLSTVNASAAEQCTAATAQSSYCRGAAHFNDTSLEGFGTNGRSCATCHVPEDSFQLLPLTVERRYAALLAARARDPRADDPLFRPIDANDFRTYGENAIDYTNLRLGLVRVAMPLPASLRLIDPRTGQPSGETTVDVWRAVPSILNVAITGADGTEPTWPLGPIPNGGYQLDARMGSLESQAIAALRDHAGASKFPDATWLGEIAAFERGQFSSEGVRQLALAIQARATSFPDPDPPLNALERKGKEIFKRTCASCHGSDKHPSTSTVASPPLKQRYHPILSACPRPTRAWCARLGCFTFPSCSPEMDSTIRSYELTLDDGRKERITTSDPGRLLLSGDVIDADSFDHSHGAFDIPGLRGIGRTAPYFHNNSATSLDDVLTFYQAFFARREVLAPESAFLNPPFGPFSDEEKPALLAYLRKL